MLAVKMETEEAISISNLNDDCLLHILKYASLQDRLNLESVCERWQYLCSLLWRKVHSFDVCSQELGHIAFESNPQDFGENDIGISTCQQVFKTCFSRLKMINLSRIEIPRMMTLMDMWHICTTQFGYEHFPAGTLNNLKDLLLECEKIEELWLCRCVVDVDDVYLSKLFAKNKSLRKLVLIEYRLIGDCFSHLSPGALESLALYECIITLPEYLNPTVSSAPNLSILSISDNSFDPEILRLGDSPGSYDNLSGINERGELDSRLGLLHSICQLKNLTILCLRHSELSDSMLRTISTSCTNLIVLDIEDCVDISDIGLQHTKSMPKLKCLDIGLSENLSDVGLQNVNKDLKVLRIHDTEFTSTAILALLRGMKYLEGLDVSHCKQLDNQFVESAIDIVSRRQYGITLEIGLYDTGVVTENIRNTCPLVKLNRFYRVDYGKYC